MLDEEAAAKFSTAAALAAKAKRSQMAKANYDKGLLTAIEVEDMAREVRAITKHCTAKGRDPMAESAVS